MPCPICNGFAAESDEFAACGCGTKKDSEEEAYSYAYNEGHADSRKREPYKPNLTSKGTKDFKKVLRQRAEDWSLDCSTMNAEWSEIDEAHALLRRKEKKARDLARKAARRNKQIRYQMGAESFEAYNPEQPRDNEGRWTKNDKVVEYDYLEERKKRDLQYGPQITLRELAETMMEEMDIPFFDLAYKMVQAMIAKHPAGDTPETRNILLVSLQEIGQTLQYVEDTDYDYGVQVMVDMLRQVGMEPPADIEEQVQARIKFEDEWAAEEGSTKCATCGNTLGDGYRGYRPGKRCKECYQFRIGGMYSRFFEAPNEPQVPDDYTYGETFGRNLVLLAEGSDKASMFGELIVHWETDTDDYDDDLDYSDINDQAIQVAYDDLMSSSGLVPETSI